jgi:hypothetical protein
MHFINFYVVEQCTLVIMYGAKGQEEGKCPWALLVVLPLS